MYYQPTYENRLRHSSIGVWILVAFFSSALGCNPGPKIAPAKGKVVFEDGSPVRVGTIETKPVGFPEFQATGAIQTDGSFVLTTKEDGDGAVVGDHQCVVVQFIVTEDVKGHKPSTLGVVHKKHRSYSTSGLVIQVPESGTSELKVVVQGIKSVAGIDESHDHGHSDIHAGAGTSPESAPPQPE